MGLEDLDVELSAGVEGAGLDAGLKEVGEERGAGEREVGDEGQVLELLGCRPCHPIVRDDGKLLLLFTAVKF